MGSDFFNKALLIFLPFVMLIGEAVQTLGEVPQDIVSTWVQVASHGLQNDNHLSLDPVLKLSTEPLHPHQQNSHGSHTYTEKLAFLLLNVHNF